MIIKLTHNSKQYQAELSQPLDISLPLKEGNANPNCYYAGNVQFNTIRSGEFIGSVAKGGTVNHKQLVLAPHGNGTHTETYGHLSANTEATVSNLLYDFHVIAQLITLEPQLLKSGDSFISYESFMDKFENNAEALIIRTLPNDDSKKLRNYSGTNPTYLDHKITEHLNKVNVKHLLVDLPSLDKEVDGGKLLAHKAFWGLPHNIRPNCTITELIFINNEIEDGLYLLNLQTMNINLDATPSRPVIFKLRLQ